MTTSQFGLFPTPWTLHVRLSAACSHSAAPATGSCIHHRHRNDVISLQCESLKNLGALAASLVFGTSTARTACRRSRQQGCHLARSAISTQLNTEGAHLVWFTGCNDMRTRDHGGLQAAIAASTTCIVPIFVLEPRHLRQPPSGLRRLHTTLLSLERELAATWNLRLIVRVGDSSQVLPAVACECGAVKCHMIVDDIEDASRAAQRAAAAALEADGVQMVRWDGSLRSAAWAACGDPKQVPCIFPEYIAAVKELSVQGVNAFTAQLNSEGAQMLASDGVPSLPQMFHLAEAATPLAVREARSRCDTSEPFDAVITEWCDELKSQNALETYAREGRDVFADRYFGRAVDKGTTTSLHASSAQWLLDGGSSPSAVFAQHEVAVRAFSTALSLGTLSAREVFEAALSMSQGEAVGVGEEWSFFGRSGASTLADVVEWREWFTLLARRTLALQETGSRAGAAGPDPRGAQSGDPREQGTYAYWRWGGQHLVRYQRWDAGVAYDGKTPALLLIHGFAASCEQWERLVYALRAQATAPGGDNLPPIFAMDLLGFGHSEKPGLSYTQHLWEAQVCDFAIEVMRGQPLILAGNSIGGGVSAGAAANLRDICRGVVLCNTAGVLADPKEYEPPDSSWKELTLQRNLPKTYSPVPIFGQRALDLFGDGVIAAIFPQIPERLADIYAARAENADAALAFAIQQGAASPGSNNVIGSGQKLLPQRPLNEVLNAAYGFGGPVLVAQGLDDRVSGPSRAMERANIFKIFRQGVTVEAIECGGHCVQDEAPELVASAILKWLPEAIAWR